MADRNLELALKIRALVQGVENVEKLTDEVRDLTRQGGEQVPDITEDMRRGVDESVLSVANLKRGLAALVSAEAVRRFIDVNASAEALEKSLAAVTGSADAAAEEMAYIRAEADRLGVEVGAAAQSFLTLAAATKGTNLEGQATRDIWSAVAGRMAELGASSADVQGAMIQLAQGASKGRFELEDLKSIAERLPGFFRTFAESLGVTTEQFFAMISAGQITADTLPALARALSQGSGEIDTFNANLGRLKNSFSELAIAIGDTGIFDALSWSIRKFAESLKLAVASAKSLAAVFQDEKALQQANDRYRAAAEALFGIAENAQAAGNAGKQAGADIAAGMSQAGPATVAAAEAAKDLAAAYKTLGLDPEVYRTGISTFERETVDAFKRLAADENVSGRALLEGFVSALDRVSGQAIPELEFAWRTLGRAAPFEDARLDADQLAVGLDAARSKTAGLWPELRKAEQAAKAVAQSYGSIAEQAAKLRAEAAGKGTGKSLEDQQSALADLTIAEMKLQRLRGADTSVADLQAQAEVVRALAARINDAERAQRALNDTAAVLEYAGATRQDARVPIKIEPDTTALDATLARLAQGITVPIRLDPQEISGMPRGTYTDAELAINRAALKFGARP